MAHDNPVRWETKVMQSKATEGFFRHSHLPPQFTLHLPPNFHQALQTSTGVAASRGIRHFTATASSSATAELSSSRAGGAILTLPSGLACPIQVPAGVTLQTASGHLYKVNMPVVVTQAPGGATVLQNPVQQIFQQLGRQPLAPPSATPGAVQANASLQAPSSESLQAPKPTLPQQIGMEGKALPGAAVVQEAIGSQGKAAVGALVRQQPSNSLETPRNADVQAALPDLKLSEACCPTVATEAMASSSSSGAELPASLEQSLDPDDIIELIIMGNELDDSVLLSDETSLSFAEELDTSVHMEPDLHTQKDIANDLEEIIQLDGTGDVSPKAEIESSRDGDDEELVGIIDAEDLKVLDEDEEEGGENSTSDSGSLSSASDTDEPSVDIIEEDPLNSGDDVSEQETPDVFDTDNIIVCQYDKVQRSKNRWKFYLKDGVMCFAGKDYVFSKAIGDAEW
ncbi:TFIIA-alpha and beta-like factor isoform X1 [Rhineura floridana]|uniref:TFIIA-alpha and beta-like factor isoform X1 n=1 Tax=Rhineura floridana TaxID=261503 RepID=UPI002AC83FC2|nr:TFIIA-alpha and beta-like factor isoform X1 [Rhineura floridana]